MNLFANASQEENKNLLISNASFLHATSNNILSLILKQFLTIKDILVLRKTCKKFETVMRPNHANMVTFCNNGDSKQIIDTIIVWHDLKYFLKQSYCSAFQDMKMFNIKENHYAVLTCTREEKIIIWNNNSTPYSKILLHQATNTNTPLNFANIDMKSSLIFNKGRKTCARITKEGLQKVKMIVATYDKFAALLSNGRVATWSSCSSHHCATIPYSHLQNVKMIFSTNLAFAALLNDGSVFAWGDKKFGGKIPDETQIKLQNVKMIFSTYFAFAALLHNGSVLAWGDEYYGGKIPDNIQIQNVKTIVSTDLAFAALFNNGSVLAWGFELSGGKILDEVQIKLQNIKMIFSTDGAFAALFNDGSVLAWGAKFFGGKIPNKVRIQLKNVTMMFSTDVTFAALLNDGKVLTWGGRGNTTLIKNIKTIIPQPHSSKFTAVGRNGEILLWEDEEINF